MIRSFRDKCKFESFRMLLRKFYNVRGGDILLGEIRGYMEGWIVFYFCIVFYNSVRGEGIYVMVCFVKEIG